MHSNRDFPKLGYAGGRVGSRVQSVVGKTLAVVGAGVLVVSAIALSLVVFAIVLTGLVAGGAYLWWKTRKLRRATRTRFAEGDVIEGVVIREVQVRKR